MRSHESIASPAGLIVSCSSALAAALFCGCSERNGSKVAVSTVDRPMLMLPAPARSLQLVRIEPGRSVRQPFLISTHEITNAQYELFVDATGYDGSDSPSSKPSERFLDYWRDGDCPPELRDYPVCRINWHHAQAFCEWLSVESDARVRLPTDAEWEWAARGDVGRIYPWGDQWDPTRCNWGDDGRIDGFVESAPVGSFPGGATPQGVLDMAGNIWEWTAEKSLRGGPWCMNDPALVRAHHKAHEDPQRADDKFGFRVVVEIQ